MRLMIGMVLACGLVLAANDAAAQNITFKGWSAGGSAVFAIDDPFDNLGSGMESFEAVCFGSPIESANGLSGCAPCDGDACVVKKKAKAPKAKSPNRKVSVKTKRTCVRIEDGKECTHTVTVGKLGAFVYNEGPDYMKAKMKVYFRDDSKLAVIIFKANNPMSASAEDMVYVIDLEPVPEVPEYEEPPDWDDPCGAY